MRQAASRGVIKSTVPGVPTSSPVHSTHKGSVVQSGLYITRGAAARGHPNLRSGHLIFGSWRCRWPDRASKKNVQCIMMITISILI